MGAKNTKMQQEVIALKAEIVSMERRQAFAVKAAVKKTKEKSVRERETLIEEERARADQLEEQKSLAELQNELLTELVAAEQVNVKLQERRNEALKWELLRQGGSQEKFKNIAKEIPDLQETLGADTEEVLNGVAKHDMAEAVEYVVGRIGDVREELQQAFLARDKGLTGGLGGLDFKDALKECLPDMPREDRQLVLLRFVREIDQSVDYGEFLEFCSRKAQTRESLKMGLTGAFAARRTSDARRASELLGGGRGAEISSAVPVQDTPGQQPIPFFATAARLSRSDASSPMVGNAGGRRGTGRAESIFSQGLVDPVLTAAAEGKMFAIVKKRGVELESLLKSKDSANTKTIPVKVFSECLKALDDVGGRDGSGNGDEGNADRLTHADRKVLYRKWTVDGEVHYDDFLRAYGYYHVPNARHSTGSAPSHMTNPKPSRRHTEVLSRPKHRSRSPSPTRESDNGAKRRSRDGGGAVTVADNQQDTDMEMAALRERARAVLVHLSEVVEEEGEEAYFAAFEEQDGDNHRTLDEDGFLDAVGSFAPEVTFEQASDVFRVMSTGGAHSGRADYDKLFQGLRKLAHRKGFLSGQAVELRVESRGGKDKWVPAQVIAKDAEDGTYTVRFKSNTPGGGRVRESGVPESDLKAMSLNPSAPRTINMKDFGNKVAEWWTGLTTISSSSKAGKRRASTSSFGGAKRNLSFSKRSISRSGDSRKSGSHKQRVKARRGEYGSGSDDSAYATELERTPRRRSGSHRDSGDKRANDNDNGSASGSKERAATADDLSSTRGGHSAPCSDGSFWSGEDDASGGSPPPSPRSTIQDAGGRQQQRATRESNARKRLHPRGRRKYSSSKPPTTVSSPGNTTTKRPHRASDSSVPGRRRSSRRGSNEKGRDGGLGSLEMLGHTNIEDKFDLYKKRTKYALSPDRSGLRGSVARSSASGSSRRKRSGAASSSRDG